MKKFILFCTSIIFILLGSCKTDEVQLPELSTLPITSIGTFSVRTGGEIISFGSSEIQERGVCFSKKTSPTIGDLKTNDGVGNGIFKSYIDNLESGTTYYLRAYATNQQGTEYGNELTFKTHSPIVDNDENSYNVISIGQQIWLSENLKTTKLNDGTTIPNVTDNNSWSLLQTPGYAWFNHNINSYKSDYGALYNWHAVNTGKLCPIGWHVPAESEWEILVQYLSTDVANKLKENGSNHWTSPNSTATNESGFFGLPGGWRFNGGGFGGINYYGRYWSATEFSPDQAYARNLDYGNSDFYRNNDTKVTGYSVRCLKNQ